MKAKRFISSVMALTLAFSLTACGNSDDSKESTKPSASTPAASTSSDGKSSAAPSNGNGKKASDIGDKAPAYKDIKLGEDYTDLKTDITFLTNRTDLVNDKTMDGYIAKFNEKYPNIKVTAQGIDDYEKTAITRLSTDNWGDVMVIPGIQRNELDKFFISFGSEADIKGIYQFVDKWNYNGQAYGIPTFGNVRGIVYNKKVWEKAGYTESNLPKTPAEFITALKKIKEQDGVTPLYTNYVADWAMGAWDDYIDLVATGDDTYRNQVLEHTAEPFKNPGNDTGAYSVYKLLYDVVKEKLNEEDFSTTDWEGSKPKLNNGEIGCMVLGSWSIVQMMNAGDNKDDIGYMPFPITVNGKQYSPLGSDYNYGINKKSDVQKQAAAEIFVKFMAEESTFAADNGCVPTPKGSTMPTQLAAFKNVVLKENKDPLKGEETFLNDINKESKLEVATGNGGTRIQKIVEAADKGTPYDDLVKDWNKKWSDALKAKNIKVEH